MYKPLREEDERELPRSGREVPVTITVTMTGGLGEIFGLPVWILSRERDAAGTGVL